MKALENLSGLVKSIATELQSAIRVETNDYTLAGWGQFINAASPVFQIGPYGTSAGLLVTQIAFGSIPDDRIKRQLRTFWDQRPFGKLYPQNVRLAFVVLALAKIEGDPELLALRDEIITELRNRQKSDGSWADAVDHIAAAAGGQHDATAWVVLALLRANPQDFSAQKGIAWLADRASGTGDVAILSPVAIAAALHLRTKEANHLRTLAWKTLRSRSISSEESISFYDYEEKSVSGSEQRRDYLCFPTFYPLSVIATQLGIKATVLENIRLSAYRESMSEALCRLSGGHVYKVPGARYAATVDQAFLALSFEQLQSASTADGKTQERLVRVYRWSTQSLLINLLLPIFLICVALVEVNDATIVPKLLEKLVGDGAKRIVEFATSNDAAIRLAFALLLVVMPAIPKVGRELLLRKFRGK